MPDAPPSRQSQLNLQEVLVADEIPLMAKGIAAALDSLPDIRTHRVAAGPSGLATAAIECNAAVAVVGIGSNSTDWLHACARLRRRQPGVRLVVLVDPGAGIDVADIVRAGAIGMLLRGAGEGQLIAAVTAALNGRGWVAPEVAGAMMQALSKAMTQGDARPVAGGLSVRELDVLRLVAEGLSNRDVAARLHISENTVKNHMRAVHEKLGVTSRTEAVVTAVRDGLLRERGPSNDAGAIRWPAPVDLTG